MAVTLALAASTALCAAVRLACNCANVSVFSLFNKAVNLASASRWAFSAAAFSASALSFAAWIASSCFWRASLSVLPGLGVTAGADDAPPVEVPPVDPPTTVYLASACCAGVRVAGFAGFKLNV